MGFLLKATKRKGVFFKVNLISKIKAKQSLCILNMPLKLKANVFFSQTSVFVINIHCYTHEKEFNLLNV